MGSSTKRLNDAFSKLTHLGQVHLGDTVGGVSFGVAVVREDWAALLLSVLNLGDLNGMAANVQGLANVTGHGSDLGGEELNRHGLEQAFAGGGINRTLQAGDEDVGDLVFGVGREGQLNRTQFGGELRGRERCCEYKF